MFGQSLLSAFGSAVACTTDTDQLFTTDVQTTSVATYQLNNATTSIPSNAYPGTAYNITYATGKFGNAAVFNGSSSYVTLTQPASLSTDNFTYSFWIYPTTNTGYGAPLAQYGRSTAARNFYSYRVGSTQKITFGLVSTGGSFNQLISTGTTPLNQWSHVVFVRDSSTQKIYLNGQLSGSLSNTTTTSTSSEPFLIGDTNDNAPDEFFTGSMDQLRIFNSALSQAAVTALYNETTTTATYPYITTEVANPNSVAYYKMSNATDQLGNYNGTATNVNFNTVGKFGFAGKFSRSGSSFMNTNFTNTLSSASFSFWVKVPSSQPTGSMRLLSSVSINPLRAGQWSFIYNGSGTVSFQLVTNGGAVTNLPNVSFSLDTWEHFVFTYDNSINTAKVYLNGNTTPVSTATIGTINETNNTTPLYLGFYPRASTYDSDSTYDQVRIYDSALSAENVTALYNEIECPALATVYYLIVAGGGGGGAGYTASTVGTGGGGGAGGLITNIGGIGLSLSYSIPYAITVGTGGNGGAPGGNSFNGGDSVFSGTGTTTIQATGGGRGGMYNNSNIGGNGGSGGGTGYSGGNAAGGLGNTPSTTPSQGNNGGYYYESSPYGASGGGGAGSAGSNGPTNVDGGSGVANSITGTSVFYAAGGGGGKPGTSGTQAGGSGIGGNGGNANSLNGTSGAANTGSGGGGAGHPFTSGSNSGSAGAGGSGIVILRYPTSKVSSFVVTGTLNTPTPIILGTDSVLKFTTGTGTVTFS